MRSSTFLCEEIVDLNLDSDTITTPQRHVHVAQVLWYSKNMGLVELKKELLL